MSSTINYNLTNIFIEFTKLFEQRNFEACLEIMATMENVIKF